MKKIFILAGELSGDKTAAWYLQKIQKQNPQMTCEAVGGDFLQASGTKIYKRFEKLNVAGVVEIIKHLRFILKFLNEVADYISNNNFDEVVLVDFPGFNLRLAKKLKKINPDLKITYLSPPQLWVWGSWRMKTLKNCCDEIIVLYPFEVDWYKSRGLKTTFLGNPVYDDLKLYFDMAEEKQSRMVILPGSRESEIQKMLPIFIQSVKRFTLFNASLEIFLPLAESIDVEKIKTKLRKLRAPKINIVRGKEEKAKILASSCLALSKPGTVSLELALLKVPTVIIFKASWISYFWAKMLVKIKYMSLPNLLLNKVVFTEVIQRGFNAENISKNLNNQYKSYLKKDEKYEGLQRDFDKIKDMFIS